MATAADLVSTGFSPGQAQGANGQVSATMSGAGTTQGTGTAITASCNIFTTVASLSGATLSDSMISDEYDILNLGANALTIYPPSGARINALSANAGFQLAPNTAVKVKKFTATRWMGFLSA